MTVYQHVDGKPAECSCFQRGKIMFRESASAIFDAARRLFTNWQALALMSVIYALLLTTLYVFVTTKEATTIQVVVTVALAFATPILFFVLQTASINFAKAGTGRRFMLSMIANCWKLFVVSLPVIAAIVLAVYLLNKVQTHLPGGLASSSPHPNAIAASAQATKASTHWAGVALTSLRYLLLGLLGPLALMHLWISASEHGLIGTFRRVSTHLARAYAARSVLIYMTGFVIFAVAPYFILFETTTKTGAWREIALLSIRLIAVFCLTLLGWVITVGALSLAEDPAPSL